MNINFNFLYINNNFIFNSLVVCTVNMTMVNVIYAPINYN